MSQQDLHLYSQLRIKDSQEAKCYILWLWHNQPHLYQMLYKKEWNLEGQELQTCIKIFESVLIAPTQTLKAPTLFENNPKCIFITLAKLLYPNLRVLDISHNNISSIQLLIKIEAPQLNDLSLSYNLITSIRPLKKGYWPQLKGLWLHDNWINEAKPLCEITSPNITTLMMELYGIANKAQSRRRDKLDFKNAIEDCQQTSQVRNKADIRAKNRIINSKMQEQLKKKYPKAHIGSTY